MQRRYPGGAKGKYYEQAKSLKKLVHIQETKKQPGKAAFWPNKTSKCIKKKKKCSRLSTGKRLQERITNQNMFYVIKDTILFR